jgi:hypothetical protein
MCVVRGCANRTNRPTHTLFGTHFDAVRKGDIKECPNCRVLCDPPPAQFCPQCGHKSQQIREQRGKNVDDSRGWDQQPASVDKAPSSEDARGIGQARVNLTFHQQACENHETNTIQYLIMPVLAGLGWNERDPAQVQREYQVVGPRGDRPDIALIYEGSPVAFIEAKRLDREYSPDYGTQLNKYAHHLSDGSVAVLTTGRFWQICSVSRGTPTLRETIDINNGALEEAAAKISHALGKSALQVDISNPPLTTATTYQAAPDRDTIVNNLKRYREQEAGWRGVPSFFVLTEKVISLIAEQRPTDLRQLRDIPGVGQATVEQHGNTIIAIVRGQWV